MELDVAVGQKINFPRVSAVVTLTADDCVLLVGDRAQFKQCFVELG